MARRTVELILPVTYDDAKTDAESVSVVVDELIATVLKSAPSMVGVVVVGDLEVPRLWAERKTWHHVGGGTLLGGGEYCCDDEYENRATGERVTFETTCAAHFEMPGEVVDLAEVERMPGVRRTKGGV